MATLNYNCTALGSHEQVVCGNYKVGGCTAFAILTEDFTISDFSSTSDWNTDISSGAVKLVEGIKAEIPEPGAVEGENPIGNGPENILDNFNWTIEVRDFNVNAANDDFYNALNERRFYVAFFHDEDNELTVNSVYPCTAIVRPVTPMLKTEKRHYLVTIQWTGKDFPERVTAPANIFNQD